MRPTLRAELIRHALGSFVLKSVGALLQLAAAIILARALGPDGYGVYGFAFAVVTLLSVPATAGLPQLIVRTVAQYDAEMRYRLMRGLLIRASQLVTILSVLLSGFAVTAYYCFGRVDLTSSAGRTYLIAMLLIPLVALSHVRMAALRGLRKVLLGLVPDVVVRWSLFVTVIAAFALVSEGRFTPEMAMTLQIGATAASFMVGVALLLHHLPRETRELGPEYQTQAWVRTALPFMFIGVVLIINQQTDIVMLEIMRPATDVSLRRFR